MNKSHYKVSVDLEADRRFQKIADRFGMTAPALTAVLVHEYSYVRPEAFFEALGTIPGDLKTRPVGRPAGSTTVHKTERKAPDQAA